MKRYILSWWVNIYNKKYTYIKETYIQQNI